MYSSTFTHSTPQFGDDNWYRFGEPDTEGDEIIFDPDCDEVFTDPIDEFNDPWPR